MTPSGGELDRWALKLGTGAANVGSSSPALCLTIRSRLGKRRTAMRFPIHYAKYAAAPQQNAVSCWLFPIVYGFQLVEGCEKHSLSAISSKQPYTMANS